MGTQTRKHSRSQNSEANKSSSVENILFSLQNETSAPEVTLDTTDRMLLQRLIRLAHVLQRQEEGGVLATTNTEAPAQSRMSRNIAPTADASETQQGGCLDNAEEDEYEESYKDDVSDCQFDDRASKSLSPNAAETESSAYQTRPHAAVEKRYRRTVNTKLQQLYASIPASGKFEIRDDYQIEMNSVNESEQAAKPAVLDKAIQYVSHLVETYHKYDQDIRELRKQVRELVEEDDSCHVNAPKAYQRPTDAC